MSFPSEEIRQKAARVLELASQKGLTVTAAESCTGGLVMSALTSVAGSSAVISSGVTTYSNAAKQRLLQVPAHILRDHGAVSEICAGAMAEGALQLARADIAVAITGIAGPGGGSPDKPVGTVCFAIAGKHHSMAAFTSLFAGMDRDAVREASVIRALDLLIAALE